MKVIKGSVQTALFFGVLVALSIWAKMDWLVLAGISILFMFSTVKIFHPYARYDHNQIEIYNYIRHTKHVWEDVTKIESLGLVRLSTVFFNNGEQLILGTLITRDYSNVLKDIVRIVEEKNSGVKIDRFTEKYAGEFKNSV